MAFQTMPKKPGLAIHNYVSVSMISGKASPRRRLVESV